MDIIALIGDNSAGYVDSLLDIWNEGACAALPDRTAPPEAISDMLREAGARGYAAEKGICEKLSGKMPDDMFCREYEPDGCARELPADIRKKFKQRYSKNAAAIVYSSGTTGRAKGVILSHFALNTNACAVAEYMGLCESSRIYIAKPLSHSAALTGELLAGLVSGARIVTAPVTVPPRFILNNIIKFGITHICLNPLLLGLLASEYSTGKYGLTTLEKIYCSGSILSDKAYAQAHSAFGDIPIYNVYGLSEAGPRVTAQREDCCKSNSVGKPVRGVHIQVVRPDGSPAAYGERGLVHVDTPSRFSGYVTGAEKHPSLYCGWLNTGDVGYIDRDGELHIVGRADDVIIINSHKIYPADVEKQILDSFEGIEKCCVTAFGSKGKKSIGCIYTGKRTSPEEIKNVLRTRLLPYEIPERFVHAARIPANTNGKISLRLVAEALSAYTDQKDRQHRRDL